MAYDYSRLLATTVRLITKFGDKVIVRSYVDAPDPAGAWKAPIRTNVDTSGYGLFTKADEQHADGTLIHIGDQLILIAGNFPRDLTNIDGSVLRGSEVWKIETVVPVKPGPTVVLYKLKVSQ